MTSVGIDVGGTKCLAVGIDRNGMVVGEHVVPSPKEGGIVGTLVGLVRRFSGVERVGVGMPGLVSPDGQVAFAPHLPEVRNMPLRKELESLLGVPVAVDNDATCAAVAEWKSGAGVGCDNMIMVTVGTGIGGGIISDGRVLRGAHGYAGEFGHDTVVRSGHPCPCGRSGCWEQYASGSGLARLAGATSGEEALQRFVDGDSSAAAAVSEFVDWVVIGLVNLINTCDPECFVLGGGVGSRRELLPLVREHLAVSMPAHGLRPVPRVERARLGHRAGAIGAALLAELS